MRACLLALFLVACASPRPAAQVGTPLAAHPLAAPDGARFQTLERYKGQVVVLDFWASWCGACKRSVPRLVRLEAAYGDRLTVLGVNSGEDAERATRAAQAFGITYPIALDQDQSLSDALGAGELPFLVVVDREGVIRAAARELDEATLAVIASLLPPSN